MLFGYAQKALNTAATFEIRPHEYDKGLSTANYITVVVSFILSFKFDQYPFPSNMSSTIFLNPKIEMFATSCVKILKL